jgi:hypothetical protein
MSRSPGFRHSPETLALMRAAAGRRRYSEEVRAQMSASRKGKPGRAQSEESKAKLSSTRKSLGLKLSLEHIQKLRAARIGKPMPAAQRAKISAANKGKNKGREGPCVKWSEYNGRKFRSTWEVRFAKALDRRGIEWQYEATRFDLGDCTYRPDFYIPELGGYWEVKGYLGTEAQKKVRLFRQHYPMLPLVVVTKPVLQMMEA